MPYSEDIQRYGHGSVYRGGDHGKQHALTRLKRQPVEHKQRGKGNERAEQMMEQSAGGEQHGAYGLPNGEVITEPVKRGVDDEKRSEDKHRDEERDHQDADCAVFDDDRPFCGLAPGFELPDVLNTEHGADDHGKNVAVRRVVAENG